jgi:hypothetical protein
VEQQSSIGAMYFFLLQEMHDTYETEACTKKLCKATFQRRISFFHMKELKIVIMMCAH